LCGLFVLVAFSHDARAEPGDELVISLLTFGPGDHPFFRFGHDALLVEDRERGTRLVYNYGTFAFDSVWLIPKFLTGKYRYWLSVGDLSRTLELYASEHRSVIAQKLRLDAAQKKKLAVFLAWNARDENKDYLYDYYGDNCATRIRDAIDRATGGALRRSSAGPARMTFRAHTARLTADAPLVYFGLYATMGSFIDRPVTVWEEMFLPARLEEQVRNVVVVTAHGPEPLVEAEVTLLGDARPPLRDTPPRWTGRMLLFGAAGGLLLAALGWLAGRGQRGARALLGAATAALGLAAGLMGCLFVLLWVATDHEVAYHNENILQCPPFSVLLLGPGIDLLLGRSPPKRAIFLVTACLASSLAGWALKVLPWFAQDNAQVIALMAPLWAGMTAAFGMARGLSLAGRSR
jgi:hypothetical protein